MRGRLRLVWAAFGRFNYCYCYCYYCLARRRALLPSSYGCTHTLESRPDVACVHGFRRACQLACLRCVRAFG